MPDDFAETLKELAKENCATAALLQEVQEVLEALAAFPCNDCGYTTVHDDHCRFAPLLDKITEDTR